MIITYIYRLVVLENVLPGTSNSVAYCALSWWHLPWSTALAMITWSCRGLSLLACNSHTHSGKSQFTTMGNFPTSPLPVSLCLTQPNPTKPDSPRGPLTMRQTKPQDIFSLSKYNKYLLVAVFIARFSSIYIHSTYLYRGISFRYCWWYYWCCCCCCCCSLSAGKMGRGHDEREATSACSPLLCISLNPMNS